VIHPVGWARFTCEHIPSLVRGLCQALLQAEIQAYCRNSRAYITHITQRQVEDERLVCLLDHLWMVHRRLAATAVRQSSPKLASCQRVFSLEACQAAS
jgi:hypothetical protein